MTQKRLHSLCGLALLLTAGFGGTASWAQTPAGDSGKFALAQKQKENFTEVQKQNCAELRQFEWRARTELKVKGTTANIRVETVRYDSDGRLQKQAIGNPQPEQAELMADLQQLAESYAHMTADQLRLLALSSSISEGEGAMEGTILVLGFNSVVSRDTVAVWADPSSFRIKQSKADGHYKDDVVHITIWYDALPHGPSYPSRIELADPKREATLLMQNSNYQRLQASAATVRQWE